MSPCGGSSPLRARQRVSSTTWTSKISSMPDENCRVATVSPEARSMTPTPHLRSSGYAAIGAPPKMAVSRIRETPVTGRRLERPASERFKDRPGSLFRGLIAGWIAERLPAGQGIARVGPSAATVRRTTVLGHLSTRARARVGSRAAAKRIADMTVGCVSPQTSAGCPNQAWCGNVQLVILRLSHPGRLECPS